MLPFVFILINFSGNIAHAQFDACVAPGRSSFPMPASVASCNKFSEQWVSEYKLKRSPQHLAKDLEAHADRIDEDRANIECIEVMAKKKATLTEAELSDLRTRSSKNISNALINGQEKGRLFSEAKETYQKLNAALSNITMQKKSTNQANRIPILKACQELIKERLQNVLHLYQQVPRGPRSEPAERSSYEPDSDIG